MQCHVPYPYKLFDLSCYVFVVGIGERFRYLEFPLLQSEFFCQQLAQQLVQSCKGLNQPFWFKSLTFTYLVGQEEYLHSLPRCQFPISSRVHPSRRANVLACLSSNVHKGICSLFLSMRNFERVTVKEKSLYWWIWSVRSATSAQFDQYDWDCYHKKGPGIWYSKCQIWII